MLKKRLERYLEYNRSRKLRAVAFNEAKASLLFRIVPFLLHANYPDLPGFVDDPECAFGIQHFEPLKVADPALIRKFFPVSTCIDTRTPDPFAAAPCIQSVKTIGSIGTIAQTEKSDCDYWLSLRFADISERGLACLREKCRLIEEWGMEKDAEIHFFLMDIDQIRENRFDSPADRESAGSALKVLLKDELLRTHILVAGKMLLWWLVPPGISEEEYTAEAARIKAQRAVNPDRFLDLGHAADLPRTEIFGACLWQMNKALDSPYKSVIKFAYLELLMQDRKKRLPLFSAHIKRLVTFPDTLDGGGKKAPMLPADIDPYLLLAREIVRYYQKEAGDKKGAALIRECLFLKTLEGMASQKRLPGEEKRLRMTMELMREWDLLPENHRYFASIHDWSFRELVDFGNRIHGYLVDTYNRLRWIFRELKDEKPDISERDLSVLGRKLFSFYEKKPGKINYAKVISREAMAQPQLTFHVARIEEKDYYYVLQGDQTRTDINGQARKVINRDTSLVRLVVWLAINHILTPKTELLLTKTYLPLNLADIQKLCESFFASFPPVIFGRIDPEQLLRPEKIERALVVVNMEKKKVDEKTLVSELITVNSYGEYFYASLDSLVRLKNRMQLLLTRHFVSRWNGNLFFYIPAQKEQHRIKTMLFSQGR